MCGVEVIHLISLITFNFTLFVSVQASKTGERPQRLLFLPLHADIREPLLHQKVSEQNSRDNRRPGFDNRSFQLATVPEGLRSVEPLFDPQCLYFLLSYLCVCVSVCVVPMPFCGFMALNINGLPYSKNNDVEQRKPLTGAAPHLLRGRG